MPGSQRPELGIYLLGGFRVAVGEVTVHESVWRLRKARGLVKLLALTAEHRLHREQVIEALWPDRDPAAASNNLRQALFVARRALDSCGDDGAARLALVSDTLTLCGEGLCIDVEVFERAAGKAERSPSVDRHRAAVDFYGGDLLPEDRFDPWAIGRREALRDRHLNLLVDLARMYDEAGDRAAAIAALQKALLNEPLHERAHRELMRIYALAGRRQRALAQFQLLRESLRREFEDEPDDETRRLYRKILTRSQGAEDEFELATSTRRADRLPRHEGNLPLQLTSFVGRERELREVVGLARRYRLVTLTGPGGSGKTRLALEIATELARDSGDGVWLVELAGLSDGELVPHAVESVLGVESRSARSAEEALVAHVGERRMLVVLDNCEHLIRACARLTERLLTPCPNVRVLATSREPLHVAGEVVWRVPSLPPAEAARDILRFWRDWVRDTPDDLCTMAAFLYAPPEPFVPPEVHGMPIFAIACFHLDLEGSAEDDLRPLRDLRPAVDVIGPMPYAAIQGMFDAGVPRGSRNYWRSGYVAELTDDAIDAILAHTDRIPAPLGQVHVHQLGGAMSRVPAGRPRSATATPVSS